MTAPRPHRLNVVGDFYVADGCCTACGVPETNAPTLFAYDPDGHCYVSLQPATSDDFDKMLTTIAQQELGCIRYRGSDARIVEKLRNLGEGSQVDGRADPGSRQASRTSRIEWPLFSWIAKLLGRLTQR
jgi:hypothetical protein